MTNAENLSNFLDDHIENAKRHISICLFGFAHELIMERADQNEKTKMKNKVQVEYLKTKKLFFDSLFVVPDLDVAGNVISDNLSDDDIKEIFAVACCEKHYVTKAGLLEKIGEILYGANFDEKMANISNDEAKKMNDRLWTFYNSLISQVSKMVFDKDNSDTLKVVFEERLVMEVAKRICERSILSDYADEVYNELYDGKDKYDELFDAANAEGNYEKQEKMRKRVCQYQKNILDCYETLKIGIDNYGPDYIKRIGEVGKAHKEYEKFKDAEYSIREKYKTNKLSYQDMSEQEAFDKIAKALYGTTYAEAIIKAEQLKPLNDEYLAMESKVYENKQKLEALKKEWFKDFKIDMAKWKKAGIKPEKKTFWQEFKKKRQIKRTARKIKATKECRQNLLENFENNKDIERLRSLLDDNQYNNLINLIDIAAEINEPVLNERVKEIIKQLETGPFPSIVGFKEIEDLVGEKKSEKEKPVSKENQTSKTKKNSEPNKTRTVNRKRINSALMTRNQILQLSCKGNFNITEENYRFFVFRGITLFGETFINQFLSLTNDTERMKMINSIDKLWDEQYVKPLKEAHINSKSYDQLVFMGMHVFGDSFVSMLTSAKTVTEKRQILEEMNKRWNSHTDLKSRLASDKSKKMTAFSAFAEDLIRLEHMEAKMHR